MKFEDCWHQLREGHDLDARAVEWMADFLLAPETEDGPRGDLLRALAAKGETEEEIAHFVRAFLRHAVRPALDLTKLGKPAIDVCGTGGDKLDLFNVSTTSMFILAGAGVAVVKHGNRGITSKSGGADVLEALGIRIDLPPADFARCVEQTGAGFMFAPHYHPAFKAVGPVRKQLATEGTRTIFNLIGPLLNPVQPPYQLAGVAAASLAPAYANILQKLGRTSAWAVHGTTADGQGMDEVSTLGPTQIWKTAGAEILQETLSPATLGFRAATLEYLRGGDAKSNAQLLTRILQNEEKGATRDIALANAAAAIRVIFPDLSWSQAVERAAQSIDQGHAAQVLRKMIDFS